MELQPASGSDSDVCKQTKAQQLPSSSSLFTRTPPPRLSLSSFFPPRMRLLTLPLQTARPGRLSDRLPYLLFDIVGNAAAIPRVTALRLNASLALLVRQAGRERGVGVGGSWDLSCPTGGAGRGDRQGIAGLRGRKGGKSKVSQSRRRFRDAGKEERNKKTLSKPQRASRSTVILR